MRTQALTDFTTQDKLSKKLIVSAEGQFFSVGLEPLRFPRRALLFAVTLHRSRRMLTTLSMPLPLSCPPLHMQVFVKIHVHTVGVLQELLCSLEDLPPLELIMSLM